MKIMQVGLGSFGKKWMKVIIDDKNWDFSSIATRNKDTLRDCGSEIGIPEEAQFTEFETMLKNSKEADAVLITTPYFLHTKQILLSLEYGKHVLVEKPLCGSLEEAYKIRDAVKKSGKTLMVAENYRFTQGSKLLHELLKSEEIGKPELIFIQYFIKHSFQENDWRYKYKYPLLIENATHHFDLVRYVTGSEPLNVWGSAIGSELTKQWKYPSLSIHYEMSKKLNFHFAGSWAYPGLNTPWEGLWRIHGTKGSIKWDGEYIKIYKDFETSHKVTRQPPQDTLKLVLNEFSKAIMENKKPAIDIKDNIRTLQMVFFAIKSIESNRKIVFHNYS